MNVAFRAECASNYQSCGWRVGFLVGLSMRYTIVGVGVKKPNRFHKGLTLSLSQKKDSLSRRRLNQTHLSISVPAVLLEDTQPSMQALLNCQICP